MSIKELTENWNNCFPNSRPVVDGLIYKFSERWFRIHTLPESKRYPKNEAEFNEILRRHNIILSDVFGTDHKYFLLSAGYGASLENLEKQELLEKINLQKNYWQSEDVSQEWEENPYYWHVYFDENIWVENSLDSLFRLIAYDECRNVDLFSPEKKIVYHPYDGGADIIFENSKLRDFYKDKYKDWLSIHPSGF